MGYYLTQAVRPNCDSGNVLWTTVTLLERITCQCLLTFICLLREIMRVGQQYDHVDRGAPKPEAMLFTLSQNRNISENLVCSHSDHYATLRQFMFCLIYCNQPMLTFMCIHNIGDLELLFVRDPFYPQGTRHVSNQSLLWLSIPIYNHLRYYDQ